MMKKKTSFKETEIGLIPEEWGIVRLGDVALLKSGYAFKSGDWTDSGIPVVKITNVKDGRVVLEGCSYVRPEIAQLATEFRLKKGDILIAMTGYVGEIAVVRDEDAVVNQRVGKFFIQQPDKLDPSYLFYYLRNPETKREIVGMGYGSAQPNISPGQVQKIEMRLPPITEQHRIASILSSLDDKIELNRQINANLEKMASALFKRWFVDFEFPDEEGKPYKTSGGKMVETEMAVSMLRRSQNVRAVGDSAPGATRARYSSSVPGVWSRSPVTASTG